MCIAYSDFIIKRICRKLDEEMTSLEFQHLNEEQGSCFDYLNEDAQDERNNLLCSKKNFTLDG